MSNKVASFLKPFIADKSGNFSIVMGVTVFLILSGMGAAIDYSMTSKKHQRFQSLADMAVLTAAVSETRDRKDLQIIVEDAVLAQGDEVDSVDFEFFGAKDKNMRVTIRGEHPLIFMHMFGHKTLKIETIAESVSTDSGVHLNMALVLDTTLSMEGSRLNAVKEASEDLLAYLEEAAATDEAVKVSVVPFSDYVRISTDYEAETWLNLQSGGPVTWTTLDTENSVNCQTVGSGEFTSTECDVEVFKDVTKTFDWHGCMVSRPDDFHMVPAFDGRRLQGSKHSNHCNSNYNQLIPMSSDLEAANTAIQNFDPIGKTYMPAGLIWGWRTLDQNLPFDELAGTPTNDVRNILLIMTDGENSASLSGTKLGFDGINHWGTGDPDQDTSIANTLTENLCTDIKDSGIEIVSIAYSVTDATTINLLSDCASSGSFFFDVQSALELKTAFAEIGKSIGTGDIRLTK